MLILISFNRLDDLHLSNTLEEDVVFDGEEVVSEVSIVNDEQNQNQNLIVQTTNDNVNQFIQQTIKSPVGQVTPIRNVTPNTKFNLTPTNQKASPSAKVVNNIVLTPKNQAQSKTKPTSTSKSITIQSNKPAATSTINLTKVIMTTSSGQQLLITSPVKHNNNSNAIVGVQTQSSTNESINSQLADKQLIGLVPISPAKQTTNKTTATTPNINIRPKPANLTIQSPSQQSTDKQPQYQIIRLVSATNSGSSINSTITTAGIKQITTANTSGGQQKVLIPASALKGLNATQLLTQSSVGGQQQQFLMYTPTQLIQQSPTNTPTTPKQVSFATNVQQSSGSSSNKSSSFVPILPNPSTVLNNSTVKATVQHQQKAIQNGSKNDDLNLVQNQSNNVASTSSASGASNRPRKPCNCTRSQCLKLYCDCFANGEFCSNCNCINCSNNLDHEENRQKAIKQCLERNPHAFHPKIGKGKTTAQEGIERRHTKGCNCRRSGCLKNYCECYEAKILCTDLCKCCACKNYEDSYERKSLMHLVDAVDIRSSLHGTTGSNNFVGKENDPLWSNEFRPKLPVPFLSDRLLSCSFITNDLVDATCKCLIAQAEKSQKLGLNVEETERAIIEEFGSCLSQIIEVANKEKQK